MVPRVNGATPGKPSSSTPSSMVYSGLITSPSTVWLVRRLYACSMLSSLPSGRFRLSTFSTSFSQSARLGVAKSAARLISAALVDSVLIALRPNPSDKPSRGNGCLVSRLVVLDIPTLAQLGRTNDLGVDSFRLKGARRTRFGRIGPTKGGVVGSGGRSAETVQRSPRGVGAGVRWDGWVRMVP